MSSDRPDEQSQPELAQTSLEHFAELLGIPAASPWLEEALTHPSFANERPQARHNQRLEFLGDAVLGLCVSDLLFQKFPEASEGVLTRLRAQLVNGEALAVWAQRIGLRGVLRFGKGAQTAGLDSSVSVLADAVEAVIASVYLEAGLDATRALCERVVEEPLLSVEGLGQRDPKSELQERLQAMGRPAPVYTVVEISGPPHKRSFRVHVYAEAELMGEGIGASKRAAERAAAATALSLMLPNHF